MSTSGSHATSLVTGSNVGATSKGVPETMLVVSEFAESLLASTADDEGSGKTTASLGSEAVLSRNLA